MITFIKSEILRKIYGKVKRKKVRGILGRTKVAFLSVGRRGSPTLQGTA